MGWRAERWKAREEIRSRVGLLAAWVGAFGSLVLFGGILQGLGILDGETEVSGFVLEHPWGALYSIAIGLALLTFALGLWKAQSWARWLSVLLCGAEVVQGTIRLVRDHGFRLGSVFSAFLLFYLLRPSTGQLFARARMAGPPTPTAPGP